MLDPALYWLMIAVILFVLELATPGFVLVFFGAGAAVTALVAWLLPDTAIALQLAIFMVVSLAAFFSLRGLMQKRFFSSAPTKDGEDVDAQLVNPGDKGVVSTTIVPPAEGRVKCAGTFWRASAGEPIAEGEMVMVVRRQGLLLEVEKI
jgi:inner membrane protein